MPTGKSVAAGEHPDEKRIHGLRHMRWLASKRRPQCICMHTTGVVAVGTHPAHHHLQQRDRTPDRIPERRPGRQPGRQPDRQPEKQAEGQINMPFCFGAKQTDLAQLNARLGRLEAGRKDLVTLKDVVKHWNDMASGNGMMRRIRAQERWQKKTDVVLMEIMRDITILERKLNGLCPLGSELETMSERATSGSRQSIRTIEQGHTSLNASSSPLSPSSVPSTFTKRKGNGIERTALDTDGLRLPRTGSNARRGQRNGVPRDRG